MIKAPRRLGLHLVFLSATALLALGGCTLRGSSGVGDVTPVAGGDGGEGQAPETQPSPTPLPTAIPATEVELSDLEVLGTQAAITATAQASGAGAAGDTETQATPEPSGGETTDEQATPGIGGEILPPTSTPLGQQEQQPAEQATECPPTHTVAGGENLYRIALRYGTDYQSLANANGITNPNQISVGQVLNIPNCGGQATGDTQPSTGTTPGTATGGGVHVVQPGENLYRIALQYNMLWTTLAAANGIQNPNVLVVGQQLTIPAQ